MYGNYRLQSGLCTIKFGLISLHKIGLSKIGITPLVGTEFRIVFDVHMHLTPAFFDVAYKASE